MARNITPSEDHFNRDGFRYEDKATTREEAFEKAKQRSLKSNAVIYVTRTLGKEEFTIQRHGVDMIGTLLIVKFHKGNLIWEFPLGTYEKELAKTKPLILLRESFEVLDALRGSISGNYTKDLARLQANGRTCGERLYNEAYQMDQQP